MPDKKQILVIAGEPSGDLHASNLVRDLKSLDPSLQFFGMGGDLSRRQGVETVFDISKLALVGVVEVVGNIFTVGKAYKAVIDELERRKPGWAILVDYPGFNLRLAKALKARNINVIYYISPQIWAWGADRVDTIKRCVRKMVVFFRFEEKLYRDRGVDAEFVGNPLLDTVKVSATREKTLEKYGLSAAKKTVALVPGSRKLEVGNFLRVMADAAAIMRRSNGGLQFIVTRHPGLNEELYRSAIASCGADIKIASGDTYNVIAASDLAIVASGTATLETAIIGTPLVVVYKANPLTYLLYRTVRKIEFLGLPNIVAGRRIVPELLQRNMTAEKIAAQGLEILAGGELASSMCKDLASVKATLGSPGASMRAARTILPLLQ